MQDCGSCDRGSIPREGERSENESEQTALLASRNRKEFRYRASAVGRSEIETHLPTWSEIPREGERSENESEQTALLASRNRKGL